jgi:hypothetical protein
LWNIEPQIAQKNVLRARAIIDNSKLNLGSFSQDAINLQDEKVVIFHTAVLAYTSARVRDTHTESCLANVHAMLWKSLP